MNHIGKIVSRMGVTGIIISQVPKLSPSCPEDNGQSLQILWANKSIATIWVSDELYDKGLSELSYLFENATGDKWGNFSQSSKS
jgi:hypothetical protein